MGRTIKKKRIDDANEDIIESNNHEENPKKFKTLKIMQQRDWLKVTSNGVHMYMQSVDKVSYTY